MTFCAYVSYVVPDGMVALVKGTFLRYNGEQKEKAMSKRTASQRVPKEMQARFEEITRLTDVFCRTYLNEEYL